MVWTNPVNRTLYADRANAEFDDTVQGNILTNCSLIAGMSSCAWVNPANIKITQNVTAGVDEVTLYDGVNAVKQQFLETIWNPAGDCCHSGETELWPGLIEKAYAKKFTAGWSDKNYEPADMKTAAWGNLSTVPLNRLTIMKGNAPAASPADFFTFLKNSNYLSPGSAYLPAFKDKQGQSIIATSYQVKFPFIALTVSHTYSILGALDRSGTKYILMRDPKAAGGGAPGGTLLTQDPAWWVNWSPYTAAGSSTDDPVWRQISLGNGIFGIKNEDFKNYFTQYAFIKS
jgi:hypothetical protein